MTFHIPLWALVPGALVVLAIWLIFRPVRGGYMAGAMEGIFGLACLAGAALFLLGRCVA